MAHRNRPNHGAHPTLGDAADQNARAPSDQDLTHQGITPDTRPNPIPKSVLIIACGAIAREVLALMHQSALNHVELRCLPAILHNRPDRIAPALRAALIAAGCAPMTAGTRTGTTNGPYAQILIGYGDCGTGGEIQAICAEFGAEMIDSPHCYAFFTGTDAFLVQAQDEITSFYLTDFLARQFDAFVTKPLKLDRYPDLIGGFFGNYEKLVYLSQTEDVALITKAKAHAEFLGLAFEHRVTGYGDLAGFVAGITPKTTTV